MVESNLMCQHMTSVVITKYIERKVTRKGGGASLYVSEKCLYSEMAYHYIVNDL